MQRTPKTNLVTGILLPINTINETNLGALFSPIAVGAEITAPQASWAGPRGRISGHSNVPVLSLAAAATSPASGQSPRPNLDGTPITTGVVTYPSNGEPAAPETTPRPESRTPPESEGLRRLQLRLRESLEWLWKDGEEEEGPRVRREPSEAPPAGERAGEISTGTPPTNPASEPGRESPQSELEVTITEVHPVVRPESPDPLVTGPCGKIRRRPKLPPPGQPPLTPYLREKVSEFWRPKDFVYLGAVTEDAVKTTIRSLDYERHEVRQRELREARKVRQYLEEEQRGRRRKDAYDRELHGQVFGRRTCERPEHTLGRTAFVSPYSSEILDLSTNASYEEPAAEPEESNGLRE